MPLSLIIVVPTLNSYRLLPKLLDSLQQQSWSSWRLLFVDGDSCSEHREWLDHCCSFEPRCKWIPQSRFAKGIFGAMNQGFENAGPDDWILFWGSDDWAASPDVFFRVVTAIEGLSYKPDLCVSRGSYVDPSTGALTRSTVFWADDSLDVKAYRRLLFFGSTPPHQATLIGPGARRRLEHYEPSFILSADLDYFLRLARFKTLRVQCLDLDFVHMSPDGISGQQTKRRLLEVCNAYRRAFGWCWCFPFVLRYLRRFLSLLEPKV